MLSKLQSRLHNEKGFTLVELLVVILIIGILAAIAIPSFLSQTAKGKDASAKSAARNAQTAAETFNVDNNGSYAGMTPAALLTIEPTLNEIGTAGNGLTLRVAPTASTYSIQVQDPTSSGGTNSTFTVARAADGTVTRSCAPVSTGGCPATGTW